ncbi:hypothetical protein [Actinotalea solisilvae]|uniref:hypothetical protein n=1 Tax=Actinotalea solisilvae TaxID=2072922 RepID=UPI0018F1AA05|nr:hypothetical protein [Actinotalea solisilvae]
MTAVRLMRRRARAHLALLALVVLQVMLTTAAVAGITGYVSVAERDSVVATLAAAPPEGSALRLGVRLADEPEEQTVAADALVESHLGGRPVVVHTSLATDPLAVTAGASGDLGDVVLWADEDLPGAATLADGAWPDDAAAAGTAADPVPAALDVDAAARLGVGPGDTLGVTVGDAPARTVVARVTGTWRAGAPDVRWAGDPLVAGPLDDDDPPGLLVPRTVLETLGAPLVERRHVAPDPTTVLPRDLPGLRADLAATAEAFEDDEGVDVDGVRVDGDLDATLAGLPVRLGGVRGVTTAAALLVVVTGLIAFSQVARLLADLRLAETVLLRSRGTSVAQVTAASLVEAVAVASAGAVAGTAAAAAALSSRGGVPVAELALVGLVAALTATLVLAGQARAHAVEVVRRGRSDAAGRARRSARAGGLALAAVGALLAGWQLDRYGSPVFTGVDGQVHVDPLAAAAVALGLLVVALAAVVALAPATSVGAARAQRRRDLLPVLTLRELTRHTPVHGVTVVLVVLAAGAGTVVAAYTGTLGRWAADVRHTAVGADVVLDLAGPPSPGVPAAAAARELPGVAAATPVRVVGAATSGAAGEVVAVAPGGPDEASAALRAVDGPPALALPDDAGRLDLAVDASAGTLAPTALGARVWLVDDAGDLVALDAGEAVGEPSGGAPSARFTWSVDVPAGGLGGWSVAAVDVSYRALPTTPEPPAAAPLPGADAAAEAPTPGPPLTVAVAGLDAVAPSGDATDLLAPGDGWTAVVFRGREASEPALADGALALAPAEAAALVGTPLRFLPGEATPPLAVVVTSDWLAERDTAVGAATRMTVAGRETEVVLVGATAVVPGSAAAAEQRVPGTAADDDAPPLAMLADLRALDRLLLRTRAELPVADAVRVTTADPQGVAAAALAEPRRETASGDAGAVGVTAATTATPTPDRLTAPAVVAAALAAACALLVMVPGVASTALALALTRAREAAVLRALGVAPARQATARRAELAVVTSASLLVGVGGGLLVAWWCVPPLVRATAPGPRALPTHLAPDLVAVAGVVAVTAALLAAVVAGYGAHVARQAHRATRVEDER